MEDTKDYFVGEVKAIFFSNPDNYYHVAKINISETNTLYSEKSIVVTGIFLELEEGATYQFFGDMVNHPRYGIQFKVNQYQRYRATTTEGVINYLSGEEFPGIGKTLAKRIVDHLGISAIDKIINDPEVLKSIKGLTSNKQTMLVERLKQSNGSQAIQLQLNEMGFSNQVAAKIYAKYAEDTIDMIREDPYRLITDFKEFSFRRIDRIALDQGLARDSEARISGAIHYLLNNYSFQSGDTYMSRALLLHALDELLTNNGRERTIPEQQLTVVLEHLSDNNQIFLTEDIVAMSSLYAAEHSIARAIEQRINSHYQPEFDGADLNAEIKAVEETTGLKYGTAQRTAIKEALQNNTYILTGGPGTGKTTVLNAIVHIYSEIHDIDLTSTETDEFPILMAAPTGRAAKRMTELTGIPAYTIHRLLHLTGEEDSDSRDEHDSFRIYGEMLDGKLLVVDEMSMIDTWLCHQLLSNIPEDMQVIFVGDQDQLPSVGPGQVLADFLRTGKIPSRELDEIFRQNDGSTITYLAHDIKNGKVPLNLTENQKDRSFFHIQTTDIPNLVANIAQKALKAGYDIKDIQVLAPMYKGESGIDRINEVMQARLNPNSQKRREVTAFDTVFRVNDKVLQLQNDAEKGVFNGDLGQIVAIFYAKETETKSDEIVVAYEDKEITYLRSEWNQLSLAYSISIHKSQGSEFPIVIIPLVRQFRRMLQRNLLYTAVTRTRQSLILCGDPQAFQTAIQNQGNQRHTQLYHLILDVLDDVAVTENQETKNHEKAYKLNDEGQLSQNDNNYSKVLTPALVSSGMISPMIGMEGVTPYDF